MTLISLADFELKYRADGDPWGYESSEYELAKYAATLEACGPGPFSCALELGGSIGVFTQILAPRCERLITVDGAATAVAAARTRLKDQLTAGGFRIDVRHGEIPADLPQGPFGLIVASEVLYYLAPDALAKTIESAVETLRPGGRLVAVHWRPPGTERPFTATEVHGRLTATASLERIISAPTREYLLDVLERRG